MLFVYILLIGWSQGVTSKEYYMDQPSGCGSYVPVGENYVNIHGRSKVAPGNPPTSCILYLQTDSTDTKYRLEVTVESLTIDDCGITLEIFDHQQAFGRLLRSIGCSSKSTDTMYSTGRFVTLKLSRSRDLYQPAYDYTLKIKAYSNEDVVGGTNRVNKISVEIIVPIIIGLLLLIFVGIILCCCYRQGRLPGMQGRKPRKHVSGSNASLNSAHSEKKHNGGMENPIVSVTGESKKAPSQHNGFNASDPIVWSALTSDTSKDPRTGRQRGRSSFVSQGHAPVPVPPVAPPYSGVHGRPENEMQRSSASNAYSTPESKRMYFKKDQNTRAGSTDNDERNVDSYLERKGVKIGIYPDDSLKRREGGHREGSFNESLGRGGKGSSSESQGRGRGSYAEAQGRSRGSNADDERRKRGSYSEKEGKEHVSRKDTNGEPHNGKIQGRNGVSPSRGGNSPSRKGSSPSRKGTSPSRQGSLSPKRRRSPGEKRRSRDLENADAPPEGPLKRPLSGFFDNPDEEGYIYSYDHLYPGDESGSTQAGDSPKASRKTQRRGSAAVEFEEDEDGYLLVHNEGKSNTNNRKPGALRGTENGLQKAGISSDGTSYETIEINPSATKETQNVQTGRGNNSPEKTRNEKASSKVNKNKSVPEAEKDFDRTGQYSSYDELSEPNETETMSNPLRSNPAVKNRLNDSRPLGDAESQPAKKKKGNKNRRADDELSEAGSVRYGIPPSVMPANQDPRSRIDSYPYTVGPNAVMPSASASMGPHGQNFISALQNQAPSSQHSSPAHVAGQSAWYVQTTPSRKGPITHGAFVMQTTSRQPSQEDVGRSSNYGQQPGNKFPDHIPPEGGTPRRPYDPASSSTPYNNRTGAPFGSNQHFSPIEKAETTPQGYPQGYYPEGGDRRRYPNHQPNNSFGVHSSPGTASDPRTSLARSHPNNSEIQPGYVDPGPSIFDEPGHRAAVMRSGLDPHTGNEVNQVVWTDSMQDPTDPPGPNPNVTRKTITRITTRAGHGDIPNPDSMNSQISFNTYADRLSVPQQNDPAFLSPSTSHQRYNGHRPGPEPAHGQVYPAEDNVAFYLGLQGQARYANTSSPRVHEAQTRNTAFRDKITLGNDSFA